MPATAFQTLSNQFPDRWRTIHSARTAAELKREDFRKLIAADVGDAGEMRSDMNLIAFGSMARREWTTGSDVDWSVLVDGQTDPEDMRAAKRVEGKLIHAAWKKPGPSGLFGSLAFSHSLVHDIGGGGDSHVNTTRRVLMLLESCSIGDGTVRDRVIRAVLARYLEEDTHFHPSHGSRSFVPRFLLNDIVRYWRTIAVDYANKTLEHDGRRWALRNIKLRMSRKLIFVSGLLMCFLCQLEHEAMPPQKDIFGDEDGSNLRFINFLSATVDSTPLDILSNVLLRWSVSTETVEMLLDSYDAFLAALNDAGQREHLEKLTCNSAKNDELFNNLRLVSKTFQEGLRRLFFEENDELKRLAQVYAIF